MIDLEVRFDTVDEMSAFMKRIMPANIYDDVEELQQNVAELQDITAILDKRTKWETLPAGTDLNALVVGTYLIPTGAVAGTLINKPNGASTMTGFIKVISGGNAGQLTMYYFICSKAAIKYWQRAYYQGAWGEWTEVDNTDSGWIDLPLTDGITAYSEAQKPRYRKIGKVVYLSGVLRGVTSKDQTVAILPAGYRPDVKVMFAIPSVGQIITKMTVDTNGAITLNRSTIEPIVAENWHSIACSFVAGSAGSTNNYNARNIYDDVELLQSQVAGLMTEVGNKLSEMATNLNGVDLNEQVGKVIIGYGNNCLNRPTGQNGYFINIPHADSPDKYNKQIWFTRPANNMFIRSMEDGVFGEWTPVRFDGGWHSLPLNNGVTPQNASEYPCRFRKINNRVYIEGCVKGLTTSSQIVCTLPEEYRPVQRYYFQAPTNAGGTDTFRVNLDGTIDWAATTGNINAANWHFITTSFLID